MNTRKKRGPVLGLVAGLLLTSTAAHAALEGRDLDGSAGSFEAYYDTALNITWLADANYAKTSGYSPDGLMAWDNAIAWANNLSFTDGVNVYDNWRLPTVAPVNGTSFNDSYSPNGGTDFGYNITSPNSELAYMFYVTLGNLGYVTPSGANSGCYVDSSDTCLDHVGPFSNLNPFLYWSGTEVTHTPTGSGGFFGSGEPGDSYAWSFALVDGVQRADLKVAGLYAWAVSPGDVTAVPEADTWALLLAGLGLVGMAARRRSG